MDEPENRADLKKQLLAECALRIEAEQHVVGLEVQVETLQQEVEKLRNEAVERQHAETESFTTVGKNAEVQAIAEVMGQCQSEMAKRMDVQSKLLLKDQHVRELQRRVAALQDASRELQQQLADELTKRAQLQGQVAEKDKRLRDIQFIAQEQELQKTRELCELQAQLHQELALRQVAQYKLIEKEHVIRDLQFLMAQGSYESSNIAERSFVSSSAGLMGQLVAGVGDESSYDFEREGGASLWEPEDEDSAGLEGAQTRAHTRHLLLQARRSLGLVRVMADQSRRNAV